MRLPCSKRHGQVLLATIRRAVVLMWPPTRDEERNLGSGTAPGASALAYSLLCVCGYRVRGEVARYGDSLGELVFFDDKEASTTWGERVWHCPGCRDRLTLPGLQS